MPLGATFALHWSTDIGYERVRDVDWIDVYGRDSRLGMVTAERQDLLDEGGGSLHRLWRPIASGYSEPNEYSLDVLRREDHALRRARTEAVCDHDRDGDLDLEVGGEVLAVFDNVPL